MTPTPANRARGGRAHGGAKPSVPRPRGGQSPARPASPSTTIAALAVALVLANVWAYSNSFAGVFLLDDVRSIEQNPNIRALWPLTQAMTAPREVTAWGRPVLSLTLALNYAMAPADARDAFAPDVRGAAPGLTERFLRNVWGYHALNLLIHLGATLALFGVIRRTLLSPRLRERFGAHATWLAWIVSLLWSLHPLQTEAVTYVVQRAESLMGFFCLLAVYCGIRATEGTRVSAWTTAAILSSIVGMGVKVVMVSAPFLILLWGVMFGPRLEPAAAARPRLRGAAWAATCALVLFIAWVVPNPRPVGFGVRGWTAWTYLLTQTAVITHYLRLVVLPSPLILLYTWPMTRSLLEVAPQAALLTSLAALTVVGLVRRHPLGFAGAWFFSILAPTSSVIPLTTEVAAEHRMYLPLAALLTCAVLGAYVLGQRILAGRAMGHRGVKVLAGVAVLTLASWYGTGTFARNRDYSSEQGMWAGLVQNQPGNVRARVSYGIALNHAGRYAEAEAQLREAVDLEEGNAIAQENLGAAEIGQRKFAEAVGHLERALTIMPDYHDAHYNLGLSYAALGRDALAVPHLERALQEQPGDPALLGALARILGSSTDPSLVNRPRAVELSERAVRATSGQDVDALNNLAAAYAGVADFVKAVAAEQAAVVLARAKGRHAEAAELEQRVAMYRSMVRDR